MLRGRVIFVCLILFAFSQTCLSNNEIIVICWNVESSGADPDTVAERISRMDRADLWGFSEVKDSAWALTFENRLEQDSHDAFEMILSTNTGSSDRLLIIYNRTKFEVMERFEIDWKDRYWYASGMKPRPSLVARFRLLPDGQEFFFMVNHLYRGKDVDPRRLDQAKKLRDWARMQSIPIIAVGDYNFDWDLDPEDAAFNDQKGFGDLTACGIFEWLEPVQMIKTHDSGYNCILDFIFLAHAGDAVSGTSRIIVTANDFPDNKKTPDHRPVWAKITFID